MPLPGAARRGRQWWGGRLHTPRGLTRVEGGEVQGVPVPGIPLEVRLLVGFHEARVRQTEPSQLPGQWRVLSRGRLQDQEGHAQRQQRPSHCWGERQGKTLLVPTYRGILYERKLSTVPRTHRLIRIPRGGLRSRRQDTIRTN